MPRLVPIDAIGDAFVAAMRRAWDDGDAVAPIDPRLPPAARTAVLAAFDVDAPVDEGDALVIATSGTSGEPKAVVLTHDAIAASARASSAALRVDPAADRWLACLPLAHIGGLSVVTRALITATPYTVHEKFDPAAVENESRCTLVSLVPTMLRRTRTHRYRRVLLGGATAPHDLHENVVRTYGMTETGSGVAYDGRALDGVELRIVDGEIQVRGPMLLRCYRDCTNPKDPDGWFATGDAGSLTHGVLTVDGRIGDVINTGGEKVWPSAVENALVSYAEVLEVAIVGRPDEEWGARVVAFVVPSDKHTPPTLDELRDHVKQTLPAYAAPRELVLLDELPRTASGKVTRDAL